MRRRPSTFAKSLKFTAAIQAQAAKIPTQKITFATQDNQAHEKLGEMRPRWIE
jgi:hypothetical protein